MTDRERAKAPQTQAERERVLAKAMVLQDEADRRSAAERDAALFSSAAAELGVGSAHLDEAAEQLRAEDIRRAGEAARAAARRAERWRWGAAVAAVAVVAGGLATWALGPSTPPEPWLAEPTAATWRLDVNPGTQAVVEPFQDEGRSGLRVEVESFVADSRGEFRVNLDGPAPAGGGFSYADITLRGSLPVTRVYLEAGGDERWRSPPIAVPQAWTTVSVDLRQFEHQRREGGKWVVVNDASPSGLTNLSVKVGHFMNDASASGDLWLDAVELR
jgi:hypothetical protein